MSSALAAVGLAGLVGLTLGTFLSETIKAAVGAIFSSGAQKRQHRDAMQSVVLDVAPIWKGYGYELDGFHVVGMTANVTVSNHSAQLVKNVRVTMHRRPTGIDSAKMVPAITAGSSSVAEINRELGLIEDVPFDEEEGPWLDLYWFEAVFKDVRGTSWKVFYNPRDQVQNVERL